MGHGARRRVGSCVATLPLVILAFLWHCSRGLYAIADFSRTALGSAAVAVFGAVSCATGRPVASCIAHRGRAPSRRWLRSRAALAEMPALDRVASLYRETAAPLCCLSPVCCDL